MSRRDKRPTLRDRFALAALTGWIASLGEATLDEYTDGASDRVFAEHQAAVAQAAYGYADAMMREREKESAK